ncbi:MAG: serine/threonine protein kinase [Chloroflexi bacterium CFX4]|nr:serine/threonine protein kinase [Chloroflexi bacterium CFX4]MDL1924011.1 serine/threonine protein kinase [Chloroflexi bacterium CFX3]
MEYSRFVGRTLGQYTLEAPLGKGGMASVYRAHQASVDRYVAIKVMTPEIANDPGFVERFQREARIIGRLEHPHILPVIDFGESDGTYYIVMRYMDGGSLDDLMRQKRLPPEEVAHYLDQIASALDYAHQKGVVHRDLKPNNVLLDRANNCYLTDFGIARIEGGEQRKLTATGSVMGTPAYMSPEQAMGRPVDGRSDIYTLGVMLYEMATGKLPFMADTSAALIFHHVYEMPPSPRQINPSLPEAVEPVFMRVLAKAPEMRYGTAEEFARDFSQALGIRSTPSKAVPSVGIASDTDKTFVGDASSAPPPTMPQKPDFTNPQAAPAHGRGGTVAVGSPLGESAIQTPAATQRGTPTALIVILGVVILALIGGVFLLLNSQNESTAQTANTQTAIAFQERTSTSAALAATSAQETQIALSATPTPSPTQTPSPTPSETPTPNLTETFVVARLATAEALETAQALQTQAAIEATETAEALITTGTAQAMAGATATFIAGRLQTAEAVELGITATVAAQNTAIANVTATIQAADRLLTAEAENIARTQTAIALRPTETATPTPRFDPLATLTAEAIWLTPTPIAALPPGEQIPELLARDLLSAIDVLRAQGVIPESANLIAVPVVTEPPNMTGNEEEENVFVIEPFSRARFYDFFFSADVIIVTTENARNLTSCGIYVAATNEMYGVSQLRDADLSAFHFYRTRDYFLEKRQNRDWETPPLARGSNAVIRESNGAINRLSMVMVEGRLTIYVNGVLIAQNDDPQFAEGGGLGYFMIRGAKGSSQLCSFDNVQLWRLN